MKIGLLTTLNTNIGDDFIRHGIIGLMSKFFPDERLIFTTVNKHRPSKVYPVWHPSRYLITATFKCPQIVSYFAGAAYKAIRPWAGSRFSDCKIVIQCGTPILWDGCRKSEWAEFIWRDILSCLRPDQLLFNLGGGSCYPWERQPQTLVGDQDEAFARMMLASAHLTTVRDSLSQKLFSSLGTKVPHLPCPALLAAQTCVSPSSILDRRVLFNFMALGAHSSWNQGIDPNKWQKTMQGVVSALRKDWDPVFICHNHAELQLARTLWPDLTCFQPNSVREYFEFAKGAFAAIVNRLHAGVGLAGMGIPSISIGTDTRLLMTEAINSPYFYIKEANADVLLESFEQLVANRERESQRLLDLRDSVFQKYLEILGPRLGKISS